MAELQGRLLAYARAGDAGGVEATLRGGAGLDTPGMDSQHPGRCAIHHASSSGHVDVVRLLISWGTDVNLVSRFEGDAGGRPVHLAAEAGYTRTLMDLLEAGADPFYYDDHGYMPLHRAAARGRWRVLKAFKYYGYDLSVRAADWSTALHLAAACGNLRLVTWLVHNGVRPDLADKHGRTALCHPQVRFHKEVQDYLYRVCRYMYCDPWVGPYFPSDYYMGQYRSYPRRNYNRQNRPYSRPEKVSKANQVTSSSLSDETNKTHTESFPVEQSIPSSMESSSVDQTTNSVLSEPLVSSHTETSSILTQQSVEMPQIEPQIKLLEGLQSTEAQSIVNTLENGESHSQSPTTVSKPLWPIAPQVSQTEPWQMDVMTMNHSGDTGECPVINVTENALIGNETSSKREVWEKDYFGEDAGSLSHPKLDMYQKENDALNNWQLPEQGGQWKINDENNSKENEQKRQNNDCLYERESVVNEDMEKKVLSSQQNSSLRKSSEDVNSNKLNNNHFGEMEKKAVIPKSDIQKGSELTLHQKLQSSGTKDKREESSVISSSRKRSEQDLKICETVKSHGTLEMKEIVTVELKPNMDNVGNCTDEREGVTSIDYYKNKERKKGKEKALNRITGVDIGEGRACKEETTDISRTGISDSNHQNKLMKEKENTEYQDKSGSFDSLKKTPQSSLSGKPEATMLNGSLGNETVRQGTPLAAKPHNRKNPVEFEEHRKLPDTISQSSSTARYKHVKENDAIKDTVKVDKENKASFSEAVKKTEKVKKNIKEKGSSTAEVTSQPKLSEEFIEIPEDVQAKQIIKTQENIPEECKHSKPGENGMAKEEFEKRDKSKKGCVSQNILPDENKNIRVPPLRIPPLRIPPLICSKKEKSGTKNTSMEELTEKKPRIKDTPLSNGVELIKMDTEPSIKSKADQKNIKTVKFLPVKNKVEESQKELHGAGRDVAEHLKEATSLSRPASDDTHKVTHKQKASDGECFKQEISLHQPDVKHTPSENLDGASRNENIPSREPDVCVSSEHMLHLVEDETSQKGNEPLKSKTIKDKKKVPLQKELKTEKAEDSNPLKKCEADSRISKNRGRNEKKENETSSEKILNGEHEKENRDRENICKLRESDSFVKMMPESRSKRKVASGDTIEKEQMHVLQNLRNTENRTADEEIQEVRSNVPETNATKIKQKTKEMAKHSKEESGEFDLAKKANPVTKITKKEQHKNNKTTCGDTLLSPESPEKAMENGTVETKELIQAVETKELKPEQGFKKPEETEEQHTKNLKLDKQKREHSVTELTRKENEGCDNIPSQDKKWDSNNCRVDQPPESSLDSKLLDSKEIVKVESQKQDFKAKELEVEPVTISKAVKELKKKSKVVMIDNNSLGRPQGEEKTKETKKSQKKDKKSKESNLKELGKKEVDDKNRNVREVEGKKPSVTKQKGNDFTVRSPVDREEPAKECKTSKPKSEKDVSTELKVSEVVIKDKWDDDSPVKKPKPKQREPPNLKDEVKVLKDQPEGEESKTIITAIKSLSKPKEESVIKEMHSYESRATRNKSGIYEQEAESCNTQKESKLQDLPVRESTGDHSEGKKHNIGAELTGEVTERVVAKKQDSSEVKKAVSKEYRADLQEKRGNKVSFKLSQQNDEILHSDKMHYSKSESDIIIAKSQELTHVAVEDQKAKVKKTSCSEKVKVKTEHGISLKVASETVDDKTLKQSTEKVTEENIKEVQSVKIRSVIINEKCKEQSQSESETEKKVNKQSSKSRRKDKQRKQKQHLQMQRIQLSFPKAIESVKQKQAQGSKMEDHNVRVSKEQHIKSKEKKEQAHSRSGGEGNIGLNSDSASENLTDSGMKDAETLGKGKKNQSSKVSGEQNGQMGKKTKREGKERKKKKQKKNERAAAAATKPSSETSEFTETEMTETSIPRDLDQHSSSDDRLVAQVKRNACDKEQDNLNETSARQELQETVGVDEKVESVCLENKNLSEGSSERDQTLCADAQVEKLEAEPNSDGVQGEANRGMNISCDKKKMAAVPAVFNQEYVEFPREADGMKSEGKPGEKSEQESSEKEDELIMPHKIEAQSKKFNGTDVSDVECSKLIPEELAQGNGEQQTICNPQFYSVRSHEHQASTPEGRKTADINKGNAGDEVLEKCTVKVKSTTEEMPTGNKPSEISEPKEADPQITEPKEKQNCVVKPKKNEPPAEKKQEEERPYEESKKSELSITDPEIGSPVPEPKEREPPLKETKEREFIVKELKEKECLFKEQNEKEPKVKETNASESTVRKTKETNVKIKEQKKIAEVNELKIKQPELKVEKSLTSEDSSPNADGKDSSAAQRSDADIMKLPQERSIDHKVVEDPTTNCDVLEGRLAVDSCKNKVQGESTIANAREVAHTTVLDNTEVSADVSTLTGKVAREPAPCTDSVTREHFVDVKAGHDLPVQICLGVVESVLNANQVPPEVPEQEQALLSGQVIGVLREPREECSKDTPLMETRATNRKERPSAFDSPVGAEKSKNAREDFSCQDLATENSVEEIHVEPVTNTLVELIVDSTQASCTKEKIAINGGSKDRLIDHEGNLMLAPMPDCEVGESFPLSLEDKTQVSSSLKGKDADGEDVPEEKHSTDIVPAVKKAETNEGASGDGIADDTPTLHSFLVNKEVDEDEDKRMATEDDAPLEGQASECLKSSTELQNTGREKLPSSKDNNHITCIVHCIFNLPAIRDYFISNDDRSEAGSTCDQGRGQVTKALTLVLKALATGSDTTSPLYHLRMLLKTLAHSGSPTNQPQDCPFTLLSTLLSALHYDLASLPQSQEPATVSSGQCRFRDTSVISEWFQCMLEKRFICEKNFSVSRSRTPVTVIKIRVPVNSHYSLQELVVRQPQPEFVEWYCPACYIRHPCRHQNWFVKTPPFLIIHVLRSECQDKATASPTFQTEYLNLCDVILPSTAQRNIEYRLHGMITTSSDHNSAAYYLDLTHYAWTHFQNSNTTKTDITSVLSDRGAVVLLYVAQN